MLVIMNSGSVLMQLSNLFFSMAGCFNDMLIIRLCLVLAYGFLLVSALLGFPSWGGPFVTGRISIDVATWCVVNIVLVHGAGVLRLLLDERRIIDLLLPTTTTCCCEEHEMLWRYFYRYSGMSRAQFRAFVLPHLESSIYETGDCVPCRDHFYIVLDGTLVVRKNSHSDSDSEDRTEKHQQQQHNHKHKHISMSGDIVQGDEEAPVPVPSPTKPHNDETTLVSGDVFPLAHISKICMPTTTVVRKLKCQSQSFRPLDTPTSVVEVESPTARVVSIRVDRLEAISIHHPPVKAVWTAILLASLAAIVAATDTDTDTHRCATNSSTAVVSTISSFPDCATVDDTDSDSESDGDSDSDTDCVLTKHHHTIQHSYHYHHLHPFFAPLRPSEEPDPLSAGSGGGLSRPFRHVWRYARTSAIVPWPLGPFPVGMRHVLSPPTDNHKHNDHSEHNKTPKCRRTHKHKQEGEAEAEGTCKSTKAHRDSKCESTIELSYSSCDLSVSSGSDDWI